MEEALFSDHIFENGQENAVASVQVVSNLECQLAKQAAAATAWEPLESRSVPKYCPNGKFGVCPGSLQFGRLQVLTLGAWTLSCKEI